MNKKVNEAPYELMGVSYDDYVRWCNKNTKKVNNKESKCMFFNLIRNKFIIKVDGKCYEKGVKF